MHAKGGPDVACRPAPAHVPTYFARGPAWLLGREVTTAQAYQVVQIAARIATVLRPEKPSFTEFDAFEKLRAIATGQAE